MKGSLVAAHLACLCSKWPDALAIHSGPAPLLIDIPSDLANQLLGLSHAFPLCELLEPELKEDSPQFLKVAGFSFRESPIFAHSAGRIDSVRSLRLLLRGLPKRVKWGLQVLLSCGETAQIELHPWREIDPTLEFRCFVRDRKLVGISQYDPDVSFPEVESQATLMEQSLRHFVNSVLDELHIPTLALDVHFENGLGASSVRLIELNPFGTGTDLCMFDSFDSDAFDGRFLYRRGLA